MVAIMFVISAKEAKRRFHSLLDQIATSHKPVKITGKSNSAVLVSEEDWRSIQETLCLFSIPGMRQSIIDGMKTPAEKCKKGLGW